MERKLTLGKSPPSLMRGQVSRFDTIQEEIPESQTIEMKVDFIDVLPSSISESEDIIPYYPDNYHEEDQQRQEQIESELMDEMGIVAIHAINNEGFLRKQIHFVIEYSLKVVVLNLIM